MTQPFWDIEVAKQQGKSVNPAYDYSPESRTAPSYHTPQAPSSPLSDSSQYTQSTLSSSALGSSSSPGSGPGISYLNTNSGRSGGAGIFILFLVAGFFLGGGLPGVLYGALCFLALAVVGYLLIMVLNAIGWILEFIFSLKGVLFICGAIGALYLWANYGQRLSGHHAQPDSIRAGANAASMTKPPPQAPAIAPKSAKPHVRDSVDPRPFEDRNISRSSGKTGVNP